MQVLAIHLGLQIITIAVAAERLAKSVKIRSDLISHLSQMQRIGMYSMQLDEQLV